jgi:hypothetical protein
MQTASGETIPVLKELTLGRRTLRIWAFVAEITDEFILGLDVLRAYNASGMLDAICSDWVRRR